MAPNEGCTLISHVVAEGYHNNMARVDEGAAVTCGG